jgi:polyisoprenoid-binding protein YceI
MKRILIPALLILAAPLAAAPAQYDLDPDHTTIMFDVFHIGFAPTIGLFGETTASFMYDIDTQALSDVQVSINAESVMTFHDARDGHVKSGDFLNVGTFPEITFVATSGTPISDTSGTVTGDLTILGETHPITLDVTLNKAADYPFGHKSFVLGLSLTGEVQRSMYGMTYGVGGDIVGDAVRIRIETEAIRAK